MRLLSERTSIKSQIMAGICKVTKVMELSPGQQGSTGTQPYSYSS